MNKRKAIACIMSLIISGTFPFSASPAYAEKTYMFGDIDGDSMITAADASAVLSEYSILSTTKSGGTFTPQQKTAADVDADGFITASDASKILGYYTYVSTTAGTRSLAEYILYGAEKPIEQSTTTTASASTASTSKTTTSTSKTTASTSKTTASTSKATTSTSKSTTSTSKATTSTSKTTASTSKTTASTSKTTSSTSKTTTSTSKATTSTSKSTTSTSKATTSTFKSTTSTSKATTSNSTTTVTTTTTTAAVTTTDPLRVAKIELNTYVLNIEVGKGDISYVTMLPETAPDKSEIWTSSDLSIATVDGEGWVVGKKAGTCIVTVTSADNTDVKAEIVVNVYDKDNPLVTTTTQQDTPVTTTETAVRVERIELDKTSLNIKVNSGDIPYVTMYPENAADKREIWTSSDNSIATVDGEGWVVGKKAGTCTVRVTSVDNPDVFAEVNVTVSDSDHIGVTGIKLTNYELNVPVNKVQISWVKMYPENATNKQEIWSCSNTDIAEVDGNGWIYGKKLGDCVVTVTSEDNHDVKAEIIVHVVPFVNDPDIEQTSIDTSKSTASQIALRTPVPSGSKGSFCLTYTIVDTEGKISTYTSVTADAEKTKSVITLLSADTNEFFMDVYLINTQTGSRSKIGTYTIIKKSASIKIEGEDIPDAFKSLGLLDVNS